ncbi:MAG: L,D-transpeptidase family protein [Lachnospiraceae bacterium]|nr:L,D-transpeptidase family protein [Lachnospiraceae bacterium]
MRRFLLSAVVVLTFLAVVFLPSDKAYAQTVASVVYDFSAYPVASGTNSKFVLDQASVAGMLQKNADGTFAQDAAGNYVVDGAAVSNFVSGLANLYNIPGCTTLNQDVERQYLTATIALGKNEGAHTPSVAVTNADVQKAQEEALAQQALLARQAAELEEQQKREQAEREAAVKAQQEKEQAEREAKLKKEQEALKAEQEKVLQSKQDLGNTEKEEEQKAAEEAAKKLAEEAAKKAAEEAAQVLVPSGQTYIDIDISDQKLVYYENGQSKLETAIVSGNARAHHNTPTGTYQIYGKQRNRTLRGANYEAFVKYWMPFVGNYGIHDANWRSSFGGSIYETDGSHGCVNLPRDAAATLYDMISVGTTVVIHD